MPPIDREPGVGTPVQEPPGAAQYRKLVAGGFSTGEADQWAAAQTQKLQAGGFKPSEIDAYWGHGDAHSPTIAAHFAGNLAYNAQHDPELANDPIAAFKAGWGMSVTGLAAAGKMPDKVLPKDAPLFNRIMAGVGQFAGDVPVAVPGFFGGATAGTGAGALVPGAGETGVSEVIGGLAGGGFGASAAPEGARQALIIAYRKGEIHTWKDALEVVGRGSAQTVKAGVMGAAGALTGNFIGGKLAAAGASPLISGGADAVANATTATAVGGAMDGHMPDAKDFEAGAIIAGAFHVGAGIDSLRGDKSFLRTKKNLEDIYTQTGIPPWEAATRAQRDPVFRQEVMHQDVNGDPVTPQFRNVAPPDPIPADRARGSISSDGADRGRTRPEARVAPEKTALPSDANHEDAAWGNDARERLMSAKRALSTNYGDHPEALAVANRAGAELGLPPIERGPNVTPPKQGGAEEGPEVNKSPDEVAADQTPENRLTTAKRKLSDLVADGKQGTPEWDRWNASFEKARSDILSSSARTTDAAPADRERTGQAALPNNASFYVNTVPEAMDHLANLERSGDSAVSPVGAVGKYQIMPGTARAYMGKDFDVKSLFDPAVNRQVAERIATDLFKRYQGNMEAIATAYNAGPKRASQLLAAPPGARLRAVPDKTMRGGYRYIEEQGAPHTETGLPMETQRYLARARLFMSGHEPEPQTGTALAQIPRPEAADDVASEVAGTGGGAGQPPSLPPRAGEEGADPDGARKWWGRQNEDTLTEAMMRQVGEQPSRTRILDPDHMLSQFVSELTPARRIDDRLIKGGDMDRTRDLGAEDMFRQTYASDTRAGVFIRWGAVDPITLDIKPGSKSVMDAAKAVKDGGGNMDGWVSYMLAMRALDKQTQGVKTGFNENVAAAFDQPKFHKKYKEATDIFNDVMTSALEYSRDSGVHSQAQVDAMVRDNPHYISFRRIMGDDESFGATGRGFKPRDSLKKMEGSDRQIVDPLMATLDNIRLMVKMADRNRAVGHIIGMVERGDIDPSILKLTDSQTIKASDESAFKPYGLPPEQAADTYGPLLAQRNAKALSDKQFLFFRNGRAEVWEAKDAQLADLIRKADSPGQANIVMSTFQTFSKLKRAGITLAPDFPVRNVLRDQITTFVADPLHPPPFVTWLRGIAHVIKQDDVYQSAVAKGSLGSALADMDADWLARDMHAVFKETGTWNGVANAVQHPIEFAQLISERLDAASRVGYFLHAQDKGVEPIKAATMSRKAYLDFAEKGTAQVADQMSKITSFFRPTLLGMKQFGEAFAERPGSTAAYAMAAISAPMITLFALNWLQDKVLPDGRKYADMPQWVKDSYFVTPEIAGVRFKLRVPDQVGFIFGGMVNRMMDTFANHDAHAFDGWVKQYLSTQLPSLLPDLAQTPIEAISNHNFFTGKSLIPASMEKASGYMQYTPYSSEVGKALSRVLGPPGVDIVGMSPIVFDQFVSGWGGSLGQSALHALDKPMGKVGRPWEVADIPFVGSFIQRTPGMSAAPIQQFYESMDDLEAKQTDFRLAMKRAEGGSVNERDIDLSAAGSAYAQAIAPIKQAITMQAAIIQGINENKDMSPEEKRQATDQLYPQLVDTARRGVEAIDDIKKQTKDMDKPAEAGPGGAGPNIPAQSPYQQPVPGANRGQAPVS